MHKVNPRLGKIDLSIHLSLSLYLSIYPSIYLFIYLSLLYLSIYLHTTLFLYALRDSINIVHTPLPISSPSLEGKGGEGVWSMFFLITPYIK